MALSVGEEDTLEEMLLNFAHRGTPIMIAQLIDGVELLVRSSTPERQARMPFKMSSGESRLCTI